MKRINTQVILEHINSAVESLSKFAGQISGVNRLETLKKEVNNSFETLVKIKTTYNAAKESYYNIVDQRRISQSTVSNLLQRKNTWTNSDIEQFTKAISEERNAEIEEKEAKQKLTEYEQLLERQQETYESTVRERYQEELLVAERNRGMSNMLTWSLMLANLTMFTISIFFVEPRRQRIMNQTIKSEVSKIFEPVNYVLNNTNIALAALADKIQETSKQSTPSIAPPSPANISVSTNSNERHSASTQTNDSDRLLTLPHDKSTRKDRRSSRSKVPDSELIIPTHGAERYPLIVFFGALIGHIILIRKS